jgi:hypothetical protein
MSNKRIPDSQGIPSPAAAPDAALAPRSLAADQPGTGSGLIVAAIGVGMMAIALALWAPSRGLDGDEGFYMAAGSHVAAGRRLYADVFYPQMPYLPWMEAIMFRSFGVSLEVARGLSIACASLSAGLLGWLLWRVERSRAAAIVGVVLYAAHGVSLHMLPLAKTYGVGNLLLLIAFAPFAIGRADRWPWAFVAGCAAGCAVGVRLPTAAVAGVLAVLAARQGVAALMGFVAGGLVGSAGWLLAAAQHPDEFWFCNVTFHSLRREVIGIVPVLMQKARVLAKWFVLPQHLVLWALVAAALWIGRPRRWAATLCLVALGVAYAAATPTYLQYMAQLFPFALLAAGPALVAMTRTPRRVALLLAVYLLGLYPAVRAVSGEHELSHKRMLWERDTVAEVVSFVRAHTGDREPLLSWWEGYPVLSDRPGFIGVGFWEANVAKKLSPELAKRYHVMRQEEIAALIRARSPAAILRTSDAWRQHEDAIAAGYRLAHRVAGVEIYLRRDASDGAGEANPS